MGTDYRLVPAGDAAVIVEFENRIDPAVNQRAVALADAVQAARIAGVRDVVPTFRSVAVYFDPLGTDCDGLRARLEVEASRAHPVAAEVAAPVHIPVFYGGDFGPDLGRVAERSRLDEAEVVRRHSLPTYRVFMLGFIPGFAYLGMVDGRIAVPRLDVPRVRVPAGSVGIAGRQTGIYPRETPGGWQIVGRTPVRPFALDRQEPFLLKPGGMVRFHAVDRREYDRLLESR